MSDDVLTVYVVYDSPADMPGHIVVRAQDVRRDGSVVPHVCAVGWLLVHGRERALHGARGHLSRMGLVRMERHQDDDPTILETWV